MACRSAFSSALALIGGTILLAGCSNWSFSPPIHGNYPTDFLNHDKVTAAAPAAGGNFVQESAHDYAGLVDMLARSGDRVDVDYFARKGIAAERGAIVPPEDNGNWAIPLEQPFGFRTQMAQARQRLVADLDNGGRDRFPSLAARTQVAYDCWLERTEDDWVHEADGACHKDFLASIGALEAALKGVVAAAPPPAAAAPVQPSHQYNVYFDFDRAVLTPEARQVVDAVANAAKADPGVQLRLVGKADLAGTDPYNIALSHRRADTVRAALRSDGIDDSRIRENWVGFHEPPVPTAPGVREPRNRVVEVTLQ
jgi:OOP family OmpA-OmpF porin